MKIRHAVVISLMILMLSSVVAVPCSMIPSSRNTEVVDSSNKEEIRNLAADDSQLEELKYNVNMNPSFESADADGWPTDYSGLATNYMLTDYAYTADTNTGAYAGYIASHGVSHGATASASLRYDVSQTPSPFLTGGLMLEFYWNTLNNPDIDVGAYTYLLVQTTNATGNYHEIRYYLSNSLYTVSNTTSMTAYLWNFTIGSWNHFNRNLGADYDTSPLTPPIDSTRRVTNFWWYAASPSDCVNTLEFLLDDVVLSNGTYSSWITNGGFETGDGQGWETSHSTPTFVSQSTDSTDGAYSLNMTTGVVGESGGWGSVERNFDYPIGTYCNEPGETVVEFDWNFVSVPALTNQYASLDVTFTNESNSYYVHFILGFGDDTFTGEINSTNEIYIILDGFNIRDTWHGIQLDLYDYISEFGSTVGTITQFEFSIYASESGAQVTLLIDDFLILSSPTGDHGFELDWYESSSTPFAAWLGAAGNISTIKQSTDSYSGTYACNITPFTTEPNLALIAHPTYVDIGPEDYLDFYWRLDSMNDGSTSRAMVVLYFESGKRLAYLLGASATYNPGNTTDVGFIIADEYNVTGTWHNLHRNITHDADQILGPEDWQISDIGVFVYYDHTAMYDSSVSLILDDIIITDGAPPIIESVNQMTATPMYYDDVHVQIAASDVRPGVDSVSLNYTTDGGSSWTSVTTTGVYDAYIPAQPYGTLVEYFVIAVDGVGLQRIDDNGGQYYSYTVGDDIDPTITIDSPTHLSDVEGLVAITTTVNDLGSGVSHVQFIIDKGAPIEDSSAPYTYNWDTDEVTLGLHEIEVVVEDIAGNYLTETIEVTVVDTIGPVFTETPNDVSYYWIHGNSTVYWSFNDTRPDTYSLLQNGTEIISGAWPENNTLGLLINPDVLGFVVHNFTLVITDEGGNSAADSVLVEMLVVPPPTFTPSNPIPSTTSDTGTTDTSTSDTTTSSEGGDSTAPLVLIAVVGVGGILIIVLVIVPVLKKR